MLYKISVFLCFYGITLVGSLRCADGRIIFSVFFWSPHINSIFASVQSLCSLSWLSCHEWSPMERSGQIQLLPCLQESVLWVEIANAAFPLSKGPILSSFSDPYFSAWMPLTCTSIIQKTLLGLQQQIDKNRLLEVFLTNYIIDLLCWRLTFHLWAALSQLFTSYFTLTEQTQMSGAAILKGNQKCFVSTCYVSANVRLVSSVVCLVRAYSVYWISSFMSMKRSLCYIMLYNIMLSCIL